MKRSDQARTFGTRVKMMMITAARMGIRTLNRFVMLSRLMERRTLISMDTIVMLNTYPNSIVTRVRRLLDLLVRRSSLSRVVKPQPVRSEMTWNRARSAGSPVKRNSMVNRSDMTQ